MARMIRKQLNIDATQDVRLKRLAAARGASESEVVREAIELLFETEEAERKRAERAVAVLDGLFEEWDRSGFAPERGARRFGLYDGI